MLMMCAFIFVCIVLWYIMHNPDEPMEKRNKHDQEPPITPQEMRAGRYMRHQLKQDGKKRRL